MSCSHSFAETSAIIWALQLAKDKKFRSIIVESDSKLYGDAINKNLEACLEIQSLLNDALILANSFVGCCFCWIKKDANSVAHELNKYVLCPNI